MSHYKTVSDQLHDNKKEQRLSNEYGGAVLVIALTTTKMNEGV